MATLPLSTTYQRSFLMVLTSDHITGATGATVTVSISKNGGAFGAPSGGATATEVTGGSAGWYYIALSTTDTGSLGDLAIHCTASLCDPTDFSDQVVAATGLAPTAAANATAVWQDLLASSDFTTSSSVGALVKAVTNLQYTVQSIGRGTVTTGASTTSIPTSAFAAAPSASVANQLVGRVVLFDWNTTTAALRGQASTISASTASATPTLTVGTLTATPANGDLFSVI